MFDLSIIAANSLFSLLFEEPYHKLYNERLILKLCINAEYVNIQTAIKYNSHNVSSTINYNIYTFILFLYTLILMSYYCKTL